MTPSHAASSQATRPNAARPFALPQTAPLVAVDIGNTSVKWSLFAPSAEGSDAALASGEYPTEAVDLAPLAERLPSEALAWCVASVQRAGQQRLRDWVASQRPQDTYHLLTLADLPIAVEVDFPERVGMDRLMAAVAAGALRDDSRPAVVVDAGSAITVDLIGPRGEFLGGAILPGLSMVARALNANTDLLPLVAPEVTIAPPAVGKSTEAAIRSGLFWGTVGAVRELVQRVAAGLPSTHLFVSGGDAQRLTVAWDPRARCVPNLVLLGIRIVARGS